jgi:hypothetical protein
MINNVALPAAAKAKLDELQVQCGAAEDALRGLAHRIANLPRDADAMRERLESERGKQSDRHRALHQLINKLLQWQRALPSGAVLEMAPPPAIELDGKTLADVLAAVRGEIGTLKGQRDATKRAPLPLAAVRELVESFVIAKIQAGQPRVGIVGDELRVQFRGDVDTMALLCWLAPEAAERALLREVEKLPERDGALAVSERERRVAELGAQLLAQERREEALICAAAESGTEILRRVDVSPAVALGVVVAAPTQQVA